MVKTMAVHSRRISIKATSGILRPKKSGVQRPLRISWSRYRARAILTAGLSRPFCQTRKADSAISKYRTVQTGPNSQSGGVKKGLLRLAYQSDMALRVKSEPRKAAEKVKARQTTNFITTGSFITIFYTAGKLA